MLDQKILSWKCWWHGNTSTRKWIKNKQKPLKKVGFFGAFLRFLQICRISLLIQILRSFFWLIYQNCISISLLFYSNIFKGFPNISEWIPNIFGKFPHFFDPFLLFSKAFKLICFLIFLISFLKFLIRFLIFLIRFRFFQKLLKSQLVDRFLNFRSVA